MKKFARIVVGEGLLRDNSAAARKNAALFRRKRIVSLNLMGSAGCGKTSLLEQTLARMKDVPIGVIEGDVAGSFDAQRLRRFSVPIVQINTKGACHLDAVMVSQALARMPLDDIALLFVENVGNLVCPAEFPLGVFRNVIVVSVPEGDEKPAKYPLAFRISDVCILTKSDLEKSVPFEMRRFRQRLSRVHPGMKLIRVSALTGENLDEWIAYLRTLIGSP